MNFEIVAIPITFVILTSVLLWFIILGKGAWYFKGLFVPLVIYFSLVVWFSLGEIAGWATEVSLPERFVMHWALIQEPSKKNAADKGAIFVWVTEINETNEPIRKETSSWLQVFSSRKLLVEPRVHRLEYTQKRHEQVETAIQRAMSGKTVVGEAKGFGNSEAASSQEGKGKGEKSYGGSLSQEQEFMFYELPAPKLPEKVKK